MFGWFRRGPRHSDKDFASLAQLIARPQEGGTWRADLIRPQRMDYSLDSLKHLDEYLAVLHREPPPEREYIQVVLRAGAYLGEVVRRLRPEWHWVLYGAGAKYSAGLRARENSLASAGVLWRSADEICFPLGKVWKCIENGAEDATQTFGHVIANSLIERPRPS